MGQIIKKVHVGPWYDFDFCSKWAFGNGTIDSLIVTRDCSKIFT